MMENNDELEKEDNGSFTILESDFKERHKFCCPDSDHVKIMKRVLKSKKGDSLVWRDTADESVNFEEISTG